MLQDPLLDFFEPPESSTRDVPEYYQTEVNPDPFVSPLDIIRKRRTSPEPFSRRSHKLFKSTISIKRDEIAIYGEYIAEKLRKFDDISRAQIQHKINNVLFEFEMEFFKKTRYVEATTSQMTDTDVITFDNTLSPFQQSPKAEPEFEEEEC